MTIDVKTMNPQSGTMDEHVWIYIRSKSGDWTKHVETPVDSKGESRLLCGSKNLDLMFSKDIKYFEPDVRHTSFSIFTCEKCRKAIR